MRSSSTQYAKHAKQHNASSPNMPILKPLFALIWVSVAFISYGKSKAVPLWQQSIWGEDDVQGEDQKQNQTTTM